ncbi:hypothetical protein [Vibrio spartinae]|uniref:SMI1 / KNR4 family protein n=1 Tax=Vibrio spartinae TaxID=1918945 RepID=A0A1N6MBC5_9VIBR|nr:hypothetical protein [Vibrio spartinae]SIO96656.1 hypothetical protein VSP9026_04459 [Vibrio spartinae]
MQKKFTLYTTSILPSGFKYPEHYIQLSKGIDFPENFIWWFEDANMEGGELAWNLRMKYKEWKHIGERNLIPFAQLNDDAAFFDGDDTTGNPRVIVIDLGNKQRSYELESFEDWLNDALEDSGIKKE